MILTALDYRPGIIVLLPLIASCLIYVLGEHILPNYREAITFAAAFPMAAFGVFHDSGCFGGKRDWVHSVGNCEGGSASIFRGCRGDDFRLCSLHPVDCHILLFHRIHAGHGEKNQTGYYSAFAMCLTATMGLCFSANLLTFFIFFEVLTVATYPLVVHYRDEEGTRSGRKYLALYLDQRTAVLCGNRHFCIPLPEGWILFRADS